MRVVIDTNCLMVSIPKIASSRWLFDAILNGTLEMGVTTDILSEYEEIISNFYNAPKLADNVVRVSPFFFWHLIENDTDDNKFVDCAAACSADYLITEDSHFRVLDDIPFPKVKPITRLHFKLILEAGGS